ncbi:hypothetical protein HEK616_32030 [Streptomyces nigrescens]|uniref:DUF4429 domain-containing protein n=1 Tax=Streptomyces nigrescens TaxID=1920 RepID=A0ABM7ZTQ7_STRNI|nr:DUF4429 domain-containing protein [Streptomyces nigrescens]BDM69716.1 hypothetical protein HEK616_32030 [Streptomyces nigrescens]
MKAGLLVAAGSTVMLLSSLGIVYGFDGHAWMTYPCTALVGVGFRVRQRGRQLASAGNVTELADSADLVVPQEPFILYLRGFEVDPRTRDTVPHGPLTVLGMPKLSEEELLVRALSEVAPVIAIGDPTDRLPQLGAQRVYYRRRGSGWKRIAGELIHTASLVVITTGDSGGLDWEYAHVQADLPLERLLIVVCGDGHHYERFRLRARMRGQFPRSELPEWPTVLSLYDRRTIRAAVRFDTAGTPSLEPLVFQKGWSHRSALETSLRRRIIDRWRSELAEGLTRPSGSTWPCHFDDVADDSPSPLSVQPPDPRSDAVTRVPAAVRGFDGKVTAYEDRVEIAYSGKEKGPLRAALGSRSYPYASLAGVELDLASPIGQQSLHLVVREGADLLKPSVAPATEWENLNTLLIKPGTQGQAEAVAEQISEHINAAITHPQTQTHAGPPALVRSGTPPYVAEGTHGWASFDGEAVKLSFGSTAPPAKRSRTHTIPVADIAEVTYQYGLVKSAFRVLRRGRSGSSLPDLKEDIDGMACLPAREQWLALVAAIRTALAEADFQDR